MTAADTLTVSAQLGRDPFPFNRVVARCPFGYPAAIEDLPYGDHGAPFPTLYYLTCPACVAAVSRLESDGGVRRWTARAAADRALRRSLTEAAAASRRRRRLLAERSGAPMNDGGASLATGVAGVRDPAAVKCLHAHVAHALAHPSYLFGRAVLAEVPDPWCADRRCASLVGEARRGAEGRSAPDDGSPADARDGSPADVPGESPADAPIVSPERA